VAVAAPVDTSADAGMSAVPKFTLGATTYRAGEAVVMKFALPVPSAGNRRAWVTIVEANKPKDSYASWEYVTDNARSATMKAPTAPGQYEARVHTDYPTKQTNMRYSVRFEVKPAAGASEGTGSATTATSTSTPPAEIEVTPLAKQKFKLKSTQLAPRETAVLLFPQAMHAEKGERFWVTVIRAGATDSEYGAYEYVADRATSAKLVMPSVAGDYQIRLHANYPTKATNVVHRVAVTVR
jgi:hypothetical protein